LILIAPAAPIGKFFHIPIDIGLGHRMIVLRERNQAGGEQDHDFFHGAILL
jgi:hypothetical protein